MRFATTAAFVLGLLATASPGAHADEVPLYQAATALASATFADQRSGGILAVKPHAVEIEWALASGRRAIDDAAAQGTILTDGREETLFAMASAAQEGKAAVAVANPYPFLALLLGSYYNELGRFEDAFRVLSLGLSLFGTGGSNHLGRHWAPLMYERGTALVGLKRLDEVLAVYDELLKAPALDNAMHARIHRGRGFALTELGRLPEAEAAYQKSLEIEPGNQRALRELDYIRYLMAGGQRAPARLAPLQPQAAPQKEEGRPAN